MTQVAAALLIALSNQGHWFGNHPGSVEIRWAAVADALPESVLTWRLEFGPNEVAGDRVSMATGEAVSRVRLTPPEVRVRTKMSWVYQLHRRDTGVLIAEGRETIHVYPGDVCAGLAERLAEKRVVICDRADGLPALLSAAHVPHTTIADPGELLSAPADIVLVGPDQLKNSPFSQTALLNRAQAGSSVMLFCQQAVPRLGGYALLRRARSARLEWRMEHPLLVGFEVGDLDGWVRGPGPDLRAVQLPIDEPVLEVVYWPRETLGTDPAPIDALLVVKQVGAGRLVLCQLPGGPWGSDPRSQLLVRNALNFLTTRPEPTPAPSRRAMSQPPETQRSNEITVPPGVGP